MSDFEEENSSDEDGSGVSYLRTEEELELFAQEFRKFPVLWKKGHPKHSYRQSRIAAYIRLSMALGLPRGRGVARRTARLVRRFRSRLHTQLLKACSARAGACASHAELRGALPRWAQRADRYLLLLRDLLTNTDCDESKNVTLDEVVSQLKVPQAFSSANTEDTPAMLWLSQRVVSGMRQAARHTGSLGSDTGAIVAAQLGIAPSALHRLWCRMKIVAVNRLQELISRGDLLPSGRLAARPSALDWAVVDLAVKYEDTDMVVLNDDHYLSQDCLRSLVATFAAVRTRGLEPPPAASTPPRARAWDHAAKAFSTGGKVISPVLMQRRWFLLKRDTRRCLTRAWRANQCSCVMPIHRAIASAFPHVVTSPLPTWADMLRAGHIAHPTSERGPAPGDEAWCDADSDENDVIVVENEIETIDLEADGSSSTDNEEVLDVDNAKTEQRTNLRSMPILQNLEILENDGDDLKQNVLDKCRKINSSVENVSAEDDKIHTNDDGAKDQDKNDKNATSPDKTIDSSKETVSNEQSQLDSYLVEALKSLDASQIEMSITYSSDEEDNKITHDTDLNVKKEIDVEKDKCKGGIKEIINKDMMEAVEAIKKTVNNLEQEIKATVKCENPNAESSKNVNTSDNNESQAGYDSNERRIRDSTDTEPELAIDVGKIAKDVSDTMHATIAASLKSVSDENDRIRKAIEMGMLPGGKRNNEDSNSQNASFANPLLIKLLQSTSERSKIIETDNLLPKNRHALAKNVNVRRFNDLSSKEMSNKRRRDMKSEITKYAMNIVNDLQEANGSKAEGMKDMVESIDPKLLMFPVVILERLQLPSATKQEKPPALIPTTPRSTPNTPNSPQLTPTSSQTTPNSSQATLQLTPIAPLPKFAYDFRNQYKELPYAFLRKNSNLRLLMMCTPCSVVVERVNLDLLKGGRVAKRVELPDIEEVRRNNKRILTAQVAPISMAQNKRAKDLSESDSDREDVLTIDESPQAARGADYDEVPGMPSEELTKLLNELAAGSVSCGYWHSGPYTNASSEVSAGCVRCAVLALRPSARSAVESGGAQKVAIPAEKKKKKTILPLGSPAPAPAAPKRKRNRSPQLNPEEAAREWQRQKDLAAVKFGVKPRTFKKKPVTQETPSEPATITPVKESKGVKILNRELSSPVQPVVTMNRSGQLSINAPVVLNSLNAGKSGEVSSSHYVIDKGGTVISPVVQTAKEQDAMKRLTLSKRFRTSAEEIVAAQENLRIKVKSETATFLPYTEESLLKHAQNQPIFKLTPNLFNPNAIASISKTLSNLTPTGDVSKSIDETEKASDAADSVEGCLPVILSVKSLANKNETANKIDSKEHTVMNDRSTVTSSEPVTAFAPNISYKINEPSVKTVDRGMAKLTAPVASFSVTFADSDASRMKPRETMVFPSKANEKPYLVIRPGLPNTSERLVSVETKIPKKPFLVVHQGSVSQKVAKTSSNVQNKTVSLVQSGPVTQGGMISPALKLVVSNTQGSSQMNTSGPSAMTSQSKLLFEQKVVKLHRQDPFSARDASGVPFKYAPNCKVTAEIEAVSTCSSKIASRVDSEIKDSKQMLNKPVSEPKERRSLLINSVCSDRPSTNTVDSKVNEQEQGSIKDTSEFMPLHTSKQYERKDKQDIQSTKARLSSMLDSEENQQSDEDAETSTTETKNETTKNINPLCALSLISSFQQNTASFRPKYCSSTSASKVSIPDSSKTNTGVNVEPEIEDKPDETENSSDELEDKLIGDNLDIQVRIEKSLNGNASQDNTNQDETPPLIDGSDDDDFSLAAAGLIDDMTVNFAKQNTNDQTFHVDSNSTPKDNLSETQINVTDSLQATSDQESVQENLSESETIQDTTKSYVSDTSDQEVTSQSVEPETDASQIITIDDDTSSASSEQTVWFDAETLRAEIEKHNTPEVTISEDTISACSERTVSCQSGIVQAIDVDDSSSRDASHDLESASTPDDPCPNSGGYNFVISQVHSLKRRRNDGSLKRKKGSCIARPSQGDSDSEVEKQATAAVSNQAKPSQSASQADSVEERKLPLNSVNAGPTQIDTLQAKLQVNPMQLPLNVNAIHSRPPLVTAAQTTPPISLIPTVQQSGMQFTTTAPQINTNQAPHFGSVQNRTIEIKPMQTAPPQLNLMQAGLPQMNMIRPGTLLANPVQAGSRQTSSVQPQVRLLHPVTFIVNPSQTGAPIYSVATGLPQIRLVQPGLPQANLLPAGVPPAGTIQPGLPQPGALVVNSVHRSPQTYPAPAGMKSLNPAQGNEATNVPKMQSSMESDACDIDLTDLAALPSISAAEYIKGRDPTALSVLCGAARARWWRLARTLLVLAEAPLHTDNPHYYTLAPLMRLIIPEDLQDSEPTPPKEQKVTSESSKPPWLKVKSFARMTEPPWVTNSGSTATGSTALGSTTAGSTALGSTAAGSTAAGSSALGSTSTGSVLAAPAQVFLENKMYQKLCNSPLTYAKVLTLVGDAPQCRRLLLRRQPLYVYCTRTHKLAPLHGQPSADQSRVSLSLAPQFSDALLELASLLSAPSPRPGLTPHKDHKEKAEKERIQIGRQIVKRTASGPFPTAEPKKVRKVSEKTNLSKKEQANVLNAQTNLTAQPTMILQPTDEQTYRLVVESEREAEREKAAGECVGSAPVSMGPTIDVGSALNSGMVVKPELSISETRALTNLPQSKEVTIRHGKSAVTMVPISHSPVPRPQNVLPDITITPKDGGPATSLSLIAKASNVTRQTPQTNVSPNSGLKITNITGNKEPLFTIGSRRPVVFKNSQPDETIALNSSDEDLDAEM